MNSDRTLWVIVSPVYVPAPGGGAVYNEILAKALAADGEDVLVIVEKFPGSPVIEHPDAGPGEVTIHRLFPYRAGRSTRDLKSYFDYVIQNILMTTLPGLIRRACHERKSGRVVVLIHSSFFYNPSVLPLLLGSLKGAAGRNTALVLDVRDPLFSDHLVPLFERFDGVIGCSRQITDRLKKTLNSKIRVQHIPIPFEPVAVPPQDAVAGTLAKYALEDRRYILNPNGVLTAKGYPLMLDSIRALRRMDGYSDVQLVTIGRARDWSERDAAAEAEGVLRYLGPVPHEDALRIAQAAILVLILSKNEGVPRSALESLGLGQRVIVPQLPEFVETIPENVAASEDPEETARHIVRVLDRTATSTYPLEQHSMKALLPLYRSVANIVGPQQEFRQ